MAEPYNPDEDNTIYNMENDEDTESESETEVEEEEEEEEEGGGSGSVGETLLIGDKNSEFSQGQEWNQTEIDGLFCPICMDAWTNEGDHHICCLPCGHIYGLSCINKWLNLKRSSSKCPQCNMKCSLKDVRKLFAPRIVAIDNEAHEIIRALEVKCALLEMKNADSSRKEREWRMDEAELQHRVKVLTEVLRRVEQLEVETNALREAQASQNRKFERFSTYLRSKGFDLDTPSSSPQH